jgi:uncharacterized protein (TIGR02145 family)
MSYQSVFRNSSNVLLANTAVGIRISVLQGSATGTPVYVETQTATTNGNGLVSLQIGTGTATTGTFAGINWAAGPYFIKTETDPAGGTNYTITGTKEMLSVPYALYAGKSAGAGAIAINDVPATMPSIQIGSQKWQAKNLDVAFYRNGDSIPQVKDQNDWIDLTTGAWCWVNNDSTKGAIYGKLYNWYAVNDARGLAPQGWHIPSFAEWGTLTETLGGSAVAGGKMKEAGTLHWASQYANGNNSSGFGALNGGLRTIDGFFFQNFAFFWSNTEYVGTTGIYGEFRVIRGEAILYNEIRGQTSGMSVRCIKD